MISNDDDNISEDQGLEVESEEALRTRTDLLKLKHYHLIWTCHQTLERYSLHLGQILYVHSGEYISLAETINELYRYATNVQQIDLLVNIDALPLCKSLNSQIYLILCALHGNSRVTVGIYHGYAKPVCTNDFLEECVNFFYEAKIPFGIKVLT